MFHSVRQCAEPMTLLHRLKVKVTLQVHGIYLWILCPLHISSTGWKIFIKLHSNVPLSETMCRTHDSATQTQGKVMGFSLEFRVCSISPEAFERFSLNFDQIFLSVRWCAELMTRLSYPRSMSHFKVVGFTLQFRVCSISPEPFERSSLNFDQMFISVRQCAEPMTQLHRLEVNVTLQGHSILPINFVYAPYLLNPLKDFN